MPENVPSTRDRVLARLAREFDSSAETIAAFLDRLSAGAKIPYLATFERLRSEGDSKRSLDAKRMFEIRDRVQELEMLEEHKTVVLDAAEREGWRDEAITARVLEMTDLDDLEDEWQAIRRRHTGVAKEARDRGLEPLARALRERTLPEGQDPLSAAEAYVDADKGVPDARAALEGAKAILIEEIEAPESLVEALLDLPIRVQQQGSLPKHHDYGPILKLDKPARRVSWAEFLLLKRAMREGFASYEFGLSEEKAHQLLSEAYASDLDAAHPLRAFWDSTLRAAWLDRLKQRVEHQVQRSLKTRADRAAIHAIGRDYEDLLLASPFRGRKVLGVLPAIRRSGRLSIIDGDGNSIASLKLAPLTDESRDAEKAKFRAFASEHAVDVVALGAGPGCREFEQFVLEALEGMEGRPQLLVVSEEGALGMHRRAKGDMGGKKAAALARRLQDPMLEWGRLDPMQVPLGPLRDEVYQSPLQRHLESIRERVLHEIGLDLGRATTDTLALLGGLGRETALKILLERDSEGGLPKLSTLVEKGHLDAGQLDQVAPFVRHAGEEPLDMLRIPPSRYGLVEEMAASLSMTKAELLAQPSSLDRLQEAAFDREDLDRALVSAIVEELRSPTTDRRPAAEMATFGTFASAADLAMGTEVEGRVTRLTDFGAFVDVGVAPAGLLHASQIAEHYVRDPSSVLFPGQVVRVRVLDNDRSAGRLSLTMRQGDIQKIPRTLGDAAAGKRRPAAMVVRHGARDEAPTQRGRFEQQRGRGGRPGGNRGGGRPGEGGGKPGERGGRPGDNRGRGGPRRDSRGRDDGGRGRGRPGGDSWDRGSNRGPFTVESAEIDETIRSERGYGGELKSFAALAGFVKDGPADAAPKRPEAEGDDKPRSKPPVAEQTAASPAAEPAVEPTTPTTSPEASTTPEAQPAEEPTKDEDFGKDFV
ncbi:MAG: S1 RNA-binding domain-containing protein [Planctomycetes bacterium]|nr:S1 RNA-binding domain-containing protein [Planctomycetota bacterium]